MEKITFIHALKFDLQAENFSFYSFNGSVN